MLWKASQKTNPMPNVRPALKVQRNQAGNRAPASNDTPTNTGAGNIISPRSGFGKPNTLPCHDWMFFPHCR